MLHRTSIATVFLFLSAAFSVGCGTRGVADEDLEGNASALSQGSSFVARGTGYYPDDSALEGGFVDMRGADLRTLQQFLAGEADYVSVAMDKGILPYGTQLKIAELDAKYGKSIVFRVVDTGGAFMGQGTDRIDICVADQAASVEPTVNGNLHITVVSASGTTPQRGSGSGSQPSEAPSEESGSEDSDSSEE
jgi:3D (Asp-Asp-Asp) domain-containing protein